MTNEPQRTRMIAWDDPAKAAQAAFTMGGLDFFKAWLSGEIPAPPIGRLMGFELLEVEAGRIVFGCQPGEYHYNPIGSVHGGVAATLFDSALACAIHSLLPAGTGYTTIELHINYLRPVTIETGYLRCEGKAIHVGRRVATSEARLTDKDGKLYGHATTTCVILSS